MQIGVGFLYNNLERGTETSTIGLAVAEFSAANKPIITSIIEDFEHTNILKNKALTYTNYDEIFLIFKNFEEYLRSFSFWNAYREYEPANVMEMLQKICLTKPKYNILQKLYTYLLNLPYIVNHLILKFIIYIRRIN